MESLPSFFKSATRRVVSALAGVLAVFYSALDLHEVQPSGVNLPWGMAFFGALTLMAAAASLNFQLRFRGIRDLCFIMDFITARGRLGARLCAKAFASKTVRLFHSNFMVKATNNRVKRLLSMALPAFPKAGILLKTIKPSSLKVKPNGTILKKPVSYATKKFLAPVGVDDRAWNVF